MSVHFRRVLVGPLLVPLMAVAWFVLAPQSADAAGAATVRVSKGRLIQRSGPSMSYPVVGYSPNRTTLTIGCKATGQRIRGLLRATSQWDRLASGAYVSHAYVQIRPAVNDALPACEASQVTTSTVQQPSGSMSRRAFIASAAVLARANQREYSIPASVTLAQAILESNWGRSYLATRANNFFGMKCFSRGRVALGCVNRRTFECDPIGKCYPVVDPFRAYASPVDSFRDHALLIATNARYAPAFAHPHDADRFIRAVHRGGYATSPTYTRDIQNVMRRYNLYQYNR